MIPRLLNLTGALWLVASAAAEEPVAILADRRINEASGLVRSLRHADVFWTHNDSGGEPCLFAIDRQGRTRAKLRLPGAANFDWEDLAAWKDAEGRAWLFVGDIGDNFHLRPSIQVYQIPEPDLPADPGHELESAAPRLWRAAYPDGRHDAESLAVDPRDGRLQVVTKREDGRSVVYAFPAVLEKPRVMTLEKVAELQFPPVEHTGKRPRDTAMATAACFAPDARRFGVVTYTHFYEWRIEPGEPLANALRRDPESLRAPLLRQLEAVCYDDDGRSLWFLSEQLPTPLWLVKRS
jgi:hypothetical protein